MLTSQQLSQLGAAVAAGDAASYYSLLDSFGQRYGNLAYQAATDSGFKGKLANNFLENKLSEAGIPVTQDLLDDIRQGLMEADYGLRQQGDGTVPAKDIATYHREVFRDLGIPPSAWTGTFLDERAGPAAWCLACSDVELEGSDPYEAARNLWNNIVNDWNGTLDDAADFFDDLLGDGVLWGSLWESFGLPGNPWSVNGLFGPNGSLSGLGWLFGAAFGSAAFPYIASGLFASAAAAVSPLVLDLDGDGVELRGLAASTASFDLDVDGFAERSGWVTGGDGLLALDWSGNGKIDNLSELFGSYGSPDGFAALALLDSNADNFINNADVRYADLRVWIDANEDGYSDVSELQTLTTLGITSIGLAATQSSTQIEGNAVSHIGQFTKADGSTNTVADVWFANDQIDTRYVGDYSLNLQTFLLPRMRGYGTVADLHIAMSLDPTLLALVRGLALTEIESATDLDQMVESILFRWAGADGVDPASRGGYDARRLATLEAFLGQPFEQNGSPNPGGSQAAGALNRAYDILFAEVKARLLIQGPLAGYFPDLTVDLASDTISGSGLIEGIAALAADLGSDAAAAMAAWEPLVPTLNLVNGYLGDLAGYEAALRQGVASSTGLPVPVEAKRLDGVAFGTAASEDVAGTAGNDVVYGGPGNDVLAGGAGDDAYIIKRGEGSERIGEGGGSDRLILVDIASSEVVARRTDTFGRDLMLYVAGTTQTIELIWYFSSYTSNRVEEIRFADGVTWGFDDARRAVLTPTANDDRLQGDDADDLLDGQGGNDVLAGEGGNDTYIYALGYGDDRIGDASGAADVVALGAGIAPGDVDVVRGGYWTQSLFLNFAGTSDSLEILGYFSSGGLIEEIRFADGTVWTYDQVNTMVQTGSPGNDSLVGDAGDNILDGGAGNDGLNGQSGNDTYVFGPGYGSDTVGEDGGFDTLLFNPGIDPDDIIARRTSSARDLTLSVAGTTDQVRIVWQFFYGGNVVEEIRFADGTVWDYDDIRVQVVKPTEGKDVLTGDAGEDFIEGRGGNDTLLGDGGNDTYGFDRGWGADTIGEGGGYDVAILGPGLAPADIVARRTNGFGDLTLYVIGTADSLRFSGYWGATWRVEEIRFADGTVWDYDDVRAEVLRPTAGNDLLAGDDADDVLDGQSGNDELWGQGGNDTYIYARGYGIDRVVESGGYDVLSFATSIAPADIVARRTDQGTNATFYLAGTSEQVYVENYFSTSNGVVEEVRFADGTVWDFNAVRLQVLKPTQSGDFLVGDDANDLLDGQGGNDDLRGKGGDDTYIFAPGYGVDRITDEGGAADALVFANGILPINILAYRTGSQGRDLTLQVAGTSDSITISFWFSNPTTHTVEEVRFENGTVWDRAATTAQTLLGTAANETINGYSSNDLIEGRGGNDNLYGVEGDDTLVGGTGADLVDGGLGNDVYRFGRGDGADRVDDNETDWAASQDRAEFGSTIAYDQLWLSRAGNDLLFSVVGSSDSLKVLNWYGTDAAKLDSFRTSDGYELTQARVEQLVQAMAQFAPPSGADPYIPSDIRQQLDQPLAAAWQPLS